jgi:DNA-binding NtrC family response regulator
MGVDNPGMSKAAHALLRSHPWQGNVRELSNTVQRALIFSRGGLISQEDISQVMGTERVSRQPDATAVEALREWIRNALIAVPDKDVFNGLMDHFAEMVIAEALKYTGGNRSRAAELLGISRPTLLSKIEKYRIHLETSVKGEPA